MTTPPAKAGGFSGNPHHRGGSRLTAQSEPENISSGVHVAVGGVTAVGAHVRTVGKSFRNVGQAAAFATNLTGVVGRDRDDLHTSLFRFVLQDCEELPPPRVVDGLCQPGSSNAFDVEVFVSDQAVPLNEVMGKSPAAGSQPAGAAWQHAELPCVYECFPFGSG